MGSNIHDMLDYLFHGWRKLSKQSPPQGLDKLIRILFQNGFHPQNVVNRKLRVFCHANEPCKSMSLAKRKEKSVQRQGITWSKESHRPLFSSKKMEQEKKKSELLSFIDKYKLVREDDLVFYIHTSMEEVQSMCIFSSIFIVSAAC